MAGGTFHVRVANDELLEALATLEQAYWRSHGAERERLIAGMSAMDARDPAWCQVWNDKVDGIAVVHCTPGPKLIDLIVPAHRVALAAKPLSRWRRVLWHIRSAIEEIARK